MQIKIYSLAFDTNKELLSEMRFSNNRVQIKKR